MSLLLFLVTETHVYEANLELILQDNWTFNPPAGVMGLCHHVKHNFYS